RLAMKRFSGTAPPACVVAGGAYLAYGSPLPPRAAGQKEPAAPARGDGDTPPRRGGAPEGGPRPQALRESTQFGRDGYDRGGRRERVAGAWGGGVAAWVRAAGRPTKASSSFP